MKTGYKDIVKKLVLLLGDADITFICLNKSIVLDWLY